MDPALPSKSLAYDLGGVWSTFEEKVFGSIGIVQLLLPFITQFYFPVLFFITADYFSIT